MSLNMSVQELWRQTMIREQSTIQDAIRNLDVTGLQITLVVNENGALLGTVTDGDVRRALLKGLSLQNSISEIMYTSPLVVTQEMGREFVLHLMRANKVHQLPVVDEERRVVGLHLWENVISPASRSNLMVIMAGGFGKRLKPFTDDCPKPMLPIAGKPMLEHIVERAKLEGFTKFIFSLHYLGHVITNYFGDGEKFGVDIGYVTEQTPLGTAGALSLINPVPDMPFIVTNGDVLTDIHYGEMLDFHLTHHAAATMAVRQHEWQHPFGVVKTKGIEIIGFEEKPVHKTHVNAGIYVLSPSTLELLELGGMCDMPTLFERIQLNQAGATIAYPMHEPWLDVGRPDDLELARNNSDNFRK